MYLGLFIKIHQDTQRYKITVLEEQLVELCKELGAKPSTPISRRACETFGIRNMGMCVYDFTTSKIIYWDKCGSEGP